MDDKNHNKDINAAEARNLRDAMEASNDQFSPQDIEEMWSNVVSRMDEAPIVSEQRQGRVRPLWFSIAAALFMVLTAGALGLYIVHNYFPVQVNATAQRKSVVLPDGSKVMLRNNSSLSYSRIWHLSQSRKVELKGQAYFDVIHLKDNRPFNVMINGLSVEVLGTTFNVWEAKDKAKVVLEHGRVKVKMDHNEKPVYLKPGDLLEVANLKTKAQVHMKRVNPELYTSWKDGRIVFTESPLSEIVDLLESNYGFRVTVSDKSLLLKKVTTRVANDDVKLLLKLLGESLPAHIEMHQKEITINRDITIDRVKNHTI